MHDSMTSKPTRELFDAYRGMFAFYNDALFAGSLPEVVLNFSRHSRSRGFFAPERWTRHDGDARTHEISINPDTLLSRTAREVASTLVHEMVHLWQECSGTAPRRAYHDRQWADKMELCGLMPSSTGAPGGKRVGQHMTHYIMEDGRFAHAFARMPSELLLPWRSGAPVRAPARPAKTGGEPEPEPTVKKRDPSKIKYSCGDCGVNVWGKEGLSIVCGDCQEPFAPAA